MTNWNTFKEREDNDSFQDPKALHITDSGATAPRRKGQSSGSSSPAITARYENLPSLFKSQTSFHWEQYQSLDRFV